MSRSHLVDLNAFIVVADQLSFRAGRTRLGVPPSALSRSMRQLEERHSWNASRTDAVFRLLGYHDARRILRRPDVIDRPMKLDGVFTFDQTQDSHE